MQRVLDSLRLSADLHAPRQDENQHQSKGIQFLVLVEKGKMEKLLSLNGIYVSYLCEFCVYLDMYISIYIYTYVYIYIYTSIIASDESGASQCSKEACSKISASEMVSQKKATAARAWWHQGCFWFQPFNGCFQ